MVLFAKANLLESKLAALSNEQHIQQIAVSNRNLTKRERRGNKCFLSTGYLSTSISASEIAEV